MIDINELSKERHKLQKKKELVFKNILQRIYNKIKLANKLNNYCYYMIPKFIVGMPLFDITKCSEYILFFLKYFIKFSNLPPIIKFIFC